MNIIFTVYPYAQPNRIYRVRKMEAFLMELKNEFEGVEFFVGIFILMHKNISKHVVLSFF